MDYRIALMCSLAGVGTGVALAGGGQPPLAEQGYSLIWQDEFDDLFVNPANWEFQTGTGSQYGLDNWGNNELQYYTSRVNNILIQNGELQITALRENFGGRSYTSARIRTAGRFTFRYGRAEARIKLPVGEGLWPAFWAMPEHSVYGGWPLSGEIDVMEASQDANYVSGAIHYGNSWPGNQHLSSGTNGSFGNEYHTFAVEWEPDRMRWYVDDELFMAEFQNSWFTGAAPGDPNAPFDQDFHLLLNMAVGGNFVPNPDQNSPFPKTMYVDHVRVYEQLQTPWGGSAHDITGRIEAEDYDYGFQGQAYNDTTMLNEPYQYRVENGVDVEVCSEGGFNVGFIREGEWIEYTVSVPQSGPYRLDARVASQSSGGQFRLLFDGADVGADFSFPATGGWQTWTTVSTEVQLTAGEHVMRWENTGGASQQYNINWFGGESLGGGCPADLAPPQGVLDLADINTFIGAFIGQLPLADLAEPFGVLDLSDINAFVTSFNAGCP
jgi:beta-glucanase (GH16 family)